MTVGENIRVIREAKALSQGEIEARTGLLRCYISRVENGHTVPSIQTLEKIARALDVPLFALFYEGEMPPAWTTTAPEEIALRQEKTSTWGRFAELCGKLSTEEKRLLIRTAERLINV